MRRALLPFVVLGAACTGGLDFGPKAGSAVYLGSVSGTVYGFDGARSTSASVFLQTLEGDVVSEFGGSFVNGQGHFQIEAVEGVYTLVAYQPGFVAYVLDVHVVGGSQQDIGEVHLQPCSPGNPCPDAPSPTPTPPPSFVIQEFTADYTEVVRNYYPSAGYDEVYVRAQNFAQGIELTFSFLDPVQFQPGVYSLTTSGVFSSLTYVPQTDPYPCSYVAMAGTVTIDLWDLNANGPVALRVSDARYDWYDQYGGTLSAEFSATIMSSQPMFGNVVHQGR